MRFLIFMILIELSQVLHVDQIADLVVVEYLEDLDFDYLCFLRLICVRVGVHHFKGLLWLSRCESGVSIASW